MPYVMVYIDVVSAIENDCAISESGNIVLNTNELSMLDENE